MVDIAETAAGMSECKHLNFSASVTVARLDNVGKFMADVRVSCAECGRPFQFLGLDPGLNLSGARVSLDGEEARLAIAPRGAQANPFQRLMHGGYSA